MTLTLAVNIIFYLLNVLFICILRVLIAEEIRAT